MNGTGISFAHLHLVLIHFPPVLSVLAAIAATAAWLLRRPAGELFRLALLLLVAAGVTTPLAYLAGGRAAEEIGRVEGIRQEAIAPHQRAAVTALVAAEGAALLAGAAAVVVRRGGAASMRLRLLVLVAAVVAAVAVGWAGLLGGAIHHPEIAGVMGSVVFAPVFDPASAGRV
jgi:uncharacterized membrane protein